MEQNKNEHIGADQDKQTEEKGAQEKAKESETNLFTCSGIP